MPGKNGFDLTEISGNLLLTVVGSEFYAINVQHLHTPTASTERSHPEILTGKWKFRSIWFIWEEIEKTLEIAIINENVTELFIIIFSGESCFAKTGLTCERHTGTAWLNGKWLVGTLSKTHQYRCSQSSYICFFEKHFFHILCYGANAHSWEMDKSTLQIFTCQNGNNDSLINPSLTEQLTYLKKKKKKKKVNT